MRAVSKSWAGRPRRGTTIVEWNGIAVIRLGESNIWDFGDLTRLREAASEVLAAGGYRLGVDLAHVALLPSGFMNMLCEWQERGFEVYLFSPRQNVRNMLWFGRFTAPAFDDVWRMTCLAARETWPADARGDAETADSLSPVADTAKA